MELFKITCHRCGNIQNLSDVEAGTLSKYACPECGTEMSKLMLLELKRKLLDLMTELITRGSCVVPIYDASFVTWELNINGESEFETYVNYLTRFD